MSRHTCGRILLSRTDGFRNVTCARFVGPRIGSRVQRLSCVEYAASRLARGGSDAEKKSSRCSLAIALVLQKSTRATTLRGVSAAKQQQTTARSKRASERESLIVSASHLSDWLTHTLEHSLAISRARRDTAQDTRTAQPDASNRQTDRHGSAERVRDRLRRAARRTLPRQRGASASSLERKCMRRAMHALTHNACAGVLRERAAGRMQ